jgi:hypothetical protein
MANSHSVRPELAQLVLHDLRSGDAEARAAFLKEFGDAEIQFAQATSAALGVWSDFFDTVDRNKESKGVVSAVAFTALNHNISSFKLFMSGYTVASGSLFRQVLEGISLALLCSAKSLTVRERFMKDSYSANNAVSDLAKHSRIIQVNADAVKTLQFAYKFYHKYAHLSKLTIAAGANFSLGGVPNVGAYFDPAKVREYRKEIKSRVSLARVLPNIMTLVAKNASSL